MSRRYNDGGKLSVILSFLFKSMKWMQCTHDCASFSLPLYIVAIVIAVIVDIKSYKAFSVISRSISETNVSNWGWKKCESYVDSTVLAFICSPAFSFFPPSFVWIVYLNVLDLLIICFKMCVPIWILSTTTAIFSFTWYFFRCKCK